VGKGWEVDDRRLRARYARWFGAIDRPAWPAGRPARRARQPTRSGPVAQPSPSSSASPIAAAAPSVAWPSPLPAHPPCLSVGGLPHTLVIPTL